MSAVLTTSAIFVGVSDKRNVAHLPNLEICIKTRLSRNENISDVSDENINNTVPVYAFNIA